MKKKTIAVFLICALFVVMASGAAAPTEEPEDTLLETALGRIEDDTYTNEYFGVGMSCRRIGASSPMKSWRK